MIDKVIKPCAVVPKLLYVVREADKQLNQIVHDMGRPGYVLVSRQMGKTNLLLNAKRNLETDVDCFTYLDVSNLFSDIQSFFRNIVDTILEGKLEGLNLAARQIERSRLKTTGLQAHKEHELELRTILSVVPGKVVICLDEIDALTKVEYSDKVFSQIRSMYFSGRTNFPDFERLTYILSGVADPSELIKNKAISPFNIGAKIYLNDFTLSETVSFVRQSGLVLDQEIISRIYYWTSGNPRVTWDICSELEGRLLSGNKLDVATVDDLIATLYLATFDLPPVDHIRKIVEADREIRSAVIALHYNKAQSLTDKIKDKLYLAGITTPKSTDGAVAFRSRIVSEALSERWLLEVEQMHLSLAERLAKCIADGDYDGAIINYEKALSDEQVITSETYFNAAYAYARLNMHDDAIDTFNVMEVERADGELFYIARYYLGISYLIKLKFPEAVDCFTLCVDDVARPVLGINFYQAAINLSIANFGIIEKTPYNSSSDDIVETIKGALQSVIDADSKVRDASTAAVAAQIKCTAIYQLYRLYAWMGLGQKALKFLGEGFDAAADSSKIRFLIAQLSLTPDREAKKAIVKNAVKLIVLNNWTISISRYANVLLMSKDDCQSVFYQLAIFGLYGEFTSLVNYLRLSEEEQGIKTTQVLYGSAMIAARQKNYEAIYWIANSAVAILSKSEEKDDLRNLISLTLIMPSKEDNADLKKTFINDFLQDDSALPSSDLCAIYCLVREELGSDNFEAALDLVNLGQAGWMRSMNFEEQDDSLWLLGRCILDYMQLLVQMQRRDESVTTERIEQLRRVFLEFESVRLPYFSPRFNEDAAKDLSRLGGLLSDHENKKLATLPRKGNVTVQFLDGSTRSGQLKNLIRFIKSGQAVIVG